MGVCRRERKHHKGRRKTARRREERRGLEGVCEGERKNQLLNPAGELSARCLMNAFCFSSSSFSFCWVLFRGFCCLVFLLPPLCTHTPNTTHTHTHKPIVPKETPPPRDEPPFFYQSMRLPCVHETRSPPQHTHTPLTIHRIVFNYCLASLLLMPSLPPKNVLLLLFFPMFVLLVFSYKKK